MSAPVSDTQLGELLHPDGSATIEQLLELVTADIYQLIKTAVELGKWANGTPLDDDLLEHCMQLVILYEHRHVPQQDRIGQTLQAPCANKS